VTAIDTYNVPPYSPPSHIPIPHSYPIAQGGKVKEVGGRRGLWGNSQDHNQMKIA